MARSTNEKVYVVFEGRRPGLYFSWPECDEQVKGYKGNIFKSFETYDEAAAKWVKYCNNHGRVESYIRSGLGQVESAGSSRHTGPKYEIGSTSQHGCDSPSTFAEDTASEVFAIQHNMQMELQQLCNTLHIPPPHYTLHDKKVVNGLEYHRYYAAMRTGPVGTPCVCMGRLAKNDYDAREDVAASLIRRVLATTGMNLNHYNVEILEERLQKIMEQKMELELENSFLNEQLRNYENRSGDRFTQFQSLNLSTNENIGSRYM